MSKVISTILPAAAGFLIGGPLGGAIGGELGVGAGIGTDIAATLGGAAIGAGTSALLGNNPLMGALGGAGGGFGSILGGPGGLVGQLGSGGAAGATSVLSQATDPIQAISNAMTMTGTSTATDAATALGFSSTNAMLQAANPGWLTLGAGMQGATANATGGLLGGASSPQVGSFTGTVAGGQPPTSAAARALTQLGMGGASGSGGAGLGTVSSLMSLGSGVYGLSNAIQEQQLAKQLESGNQYSSGYAAQLNSLMKNPSSVTSMPGYQAGMDAVERSMAAQGYQGSGNMAAALQQYGGNFFNNAVTQLQGLASPTGGVQALQAAGLANQSSSQALAALGYGAAGLGL